jgi:cbb3-type cytochrome oxidase subunit 3
LNDASRDILRATISGIWTALGSIVLLCGVGCLIAFAAGAEGILWCGVGCVLGGSTLIGAGVVWYYAFRPRGVNSH